MLQGSLVQTAEGAGDAVDIRDVVMESDDVIARNRNALGGVDAGRSSWTRVRRGTGCVLTGSDGKDCHSKWNKPLHESPPGKECRMDRRSHRLVSMVQRVVGPIYDKPAASAARGGQFDEEDGAKVEANI